MEIQLSKVDPDIDRLSPIKQLYEEAFPPIERVDFSHLINCVKANKADLFQLMDDDRFIGFAFLILPATYAYLLFCAIIPSRRSCGYGTLMIKTLQKFYGTRRLVVDIETLNDNADNIQERYRRFAFYIRNGFKDTHYEMHDATGDFRILTVDGTLDLCNFQQSYQILPESFIDTTIVEKGPILQTSVD